MCAIGDVLHDEFDIWTAEVGLGSIVSAGMQIGDDFSVGVYVSVGAIVGIGVDTFDE